MNSVSIYFPAGDFLEALRRYDQGREQIYQTHNEVVCLFHDLLTAGHAVNIFSFMTPEYREVRPIDGLRITGLGAKDYTDSGVLKSTIANDSSDAIVAHFSNQDLFHATSERDCRTCAVLASSFNRGGIRSVFDKRRTVALLNSPRVEFVANHCLPSTRHLAEIGVTPTKLIAWDVPHPFNPAPGPGKTLSRSRDFKVMYAGSVVEDKGISDLVRATALLREQGIELHSTIAGFGDVGSMRELAVRLSVSDLFSFVGVIGNTEVFNMMSAADLVVVPSRTIYPEGFPLSMFEAIASRTPIVCSDHPMFRDVMIDGRNSSVFPSGDYREFAAALKRTLTNSPLYETLSASAPVTWEALKGPADWRTLLFKWVVEGVSSPWICNRMLMPVSEAPRLDCGFDIASLSPAS